MKESSYHLFPRFFDRTGRDFPAAYARKPLSVPIYSIAGVKWDSEANNNDEYVGPAVNTIGFYTIDLIMHIFLSD